MIAAGLLMFCLLASFIHSGDSDRTLLNHNLTLNQIDFEVGGKRGGIRPAGQNVSSGILNLYLASLDSKEYELDLIKVRATVANGSPSLQVTASDGRDSVAFAVPHLLKNSNQPINSVVRVMCPILGQDINKANNPSDGNPMLAVSVMTTSVEVVHYDLYVGVFDRGQFFIRLPTGKQDELSVTRTDKVAYNDPLAFRVDLRSDAQRQNLKLTINSDDDICAVLAVQNFSCPLYQTAYDAAQASQYLTFTRHAMLTIDPTTMLSNFTILFFVYPDDSPCGFHTIRNAIERKSISIKFESERPTSYVWPVLAFCLVFGAFYIVYFLKSVVATIRRILKLQSPIELSVRYHDSDGVEQRSSQQTSSIPLNQDESRCADQQSSTKYPPELLLHLSSESEPSTVHGENAPSTVSSSDSDLLSFGLEQPCTSRGDEPQRPRLCSKSKLVASSHISSLVDQKEGTLSDQQCIFDRLGYSGAGAKLSMLQSLMTEDSKQYQWHEILITLYTLPVVIQVASTYFSWRLTSGNADICYHNFACAKPLGMLVSFNHVFSNFSYFALGVLFLIFVSNRKSSIAKRLSASSEADNNGAGTHQQTMIGVAQNNGLLRAMGLAMVAESIGSALYHICPNSAAFQFDTPFIQVLIVLILLKLYAARHGATQAYWAFGLIGVILAVDFAATAANHQQTTKVCLLVVHLLAVVISEIQIYFGAVRRPLESLKTMRELIKLEMSHKHYQPLFARRLIMLAFIFGVNALFAAYLFVVDPLNANMSVMSILVVNLITYFAYYVVNKIICKETLSLTAWASLAAALLLWSAAAMFFTQKTTNWALSPAQSRALNKDCMLFDFFDAHDLWHVTSSMAAFFSLVAVTVIDDNQLSIPRSHISIF